MAALDRSEKRFESDIEEYLLTECGYIKGNQATYDKDKAVDLLLMRTFIANTQPKAWERFCKIYGEDTDKQLYKRFNEEVEARGLIDVLRKGVKDRGVELRFCYFKPASELNEEVTERYNQNILTCTRQFRYSTQNSNSIDMVLSLNGIPVVAIELKDQLTGQSVEDAKLQFMTNRDPREPIFGFNRRVLVCFAVDLYEVWMTTRLQGDKTVFLPFNQGSNGAGKVGDAGNPACEDDYITSYLWKYVLEKDMLMSLLQRYISVQVDEYAEIVDGRRVTRKAAPKIIFPRYHQLDVVEKLVDDVCERGAGKNYLIQHSAGSGKSNSIAWLTYRLASVHDKFDEAIFDSVFVVTDRRVLNRQLQNTVIGFDHPAGQIAVVTDKDSSDVLRQAIDDGKKIIITTLHRFPIIYNAVGSQKGKRFAVIVDEAHSSQTGDSAQKLKAVLADTSISLKEYAEVNDIDIDDIDEEDELIGEMLTQGRHENLSFFAFTATPKPKTLEMFGERLPDGRFDAFHHYSMRQAIAEGFILDVLSNYSTMESSWEIAKTIKENPEYEETPATKAILKFKRNHELVLQQKVEIIVEQFRQVTLSKMHGKAKAMLVSPSRMHAVRYYQAIKKYCDKNGYTDVLPMIAFSGSIEIDGEEYTETKINSAGGVKISEAQLPDFFASDAFNLLVVADKYQTGFDEPKLHTMFVDKKFRGVKAVQTLSRLNRTCKSAGKVDTYILDFENKAEDIEKAFKTFYEETQLECALDVNVVYGYHDRLLKFRLWNEDDIAKFMAVYSSVNRQSAKDLGKITATLRPALQGYIALSEENQYAFRTALKNFIRFYAYITQVARMFDEDLHKTYLFCEYLFRLLPKRHVETVNLDDEVVLLNSSLTETFSGCIELHPSDKDKTLAPEKPKKSAPRTEKRDLLQNIIDKINLIYRGQFTGADRIIVETIFDRMYSSGRRLKKHALNSDEEMFVQSIFPDEFEKVAQDCYADSVDGFSKLFENKEFYKEVMMQMAHALYLSYRKKHD